MSEDAKEWYDYFRTLFPKVTIEKIDEFSKRYKNSEEEKNDIIQYYNESKGDFGYIMDNVMLAEEEDEKRIIEIIESAVNNKDLKQGAKWEKSIKSYNVRKEKEKKAALKEEKNEKDNKNNKEKKSSKRKNDEAQLIEMMQKNRDNMAFSFANICKKYSENNKEIFNDDIPDDEFEKIRSNITKNKKSKK